MQASKLPPRRDGRIIIHFDYDCFYAAVFEAKNPSLKSLPFAVQQKQIIVTCNYEARRRGLHKLQLIREARRICPDVIIELGEDISRFRDASKELYKFIEAYTWNGKVERLGFDEVWMDVTDVVDFNMEILNRNNLPSSFFHMSREDPEIGFTFDATSVAGHTFPGDHAKHEDVENVALDGLSMRLRLGSHLALYVRHQLEQHKGYTSTVGIATSKLLSKLVGNVNKPKGQTTLMPPLDESDEGKSNVATFMDDHEIGKVPGIGFKLAQKIREHVLQRPGDFSNGLIYGTTRENVTVGDVRNAPEVNPEMFEKLLAGPGSPHGIGYKVWCLIHGVDDAEVSRMRQIPRQISIEDSYIRLDTMPEVLGELTALSKSLLTRMRIDLLGVDDGMDPEHDGGGISDDAVATTLDTMAEKKWLAHPKTLRLTTRPRQQLLPDGTRPRSFKRISHSGPLPSFVFKLNESIDTLAAKLVSEALMGMFRRLHPEKAGWNLSLVNLAVTNMAETAGDSRTASGRDIGNMFKRQDDVLRDFKVVDSDEEMEAGQEVNEVKGTVTGDDGNTEERRYEVGGLDASQERCSLCGSRLPAFAMVAHQRFHSLDAQ